KNWLKYNASLVTLSDERVFNEAFSLSQVYVPLNAYYEEKDNVNDGNSDTTINNNNEEEITKVAFDLHDYIHQWVNNFDKDNALKVIRGGPGCGKSSFSRMLVAEVAERGDVPVLFIPLHHFDPSKDLTQAVDDFIKKEGMAVTNPLDATNGQERLLIVFDGLDELSMKSQADSEVAQNFVQEVHDVLYRFNSGGTLKRQAIITGRDIVVQSSEQRLRKPQQILHMLPYYLDEDEQQEYKDKDKKLTQDLRNTWWKKFGIAKGLDYKNIPEELNTESLTPITREPLLNYLVALSYQRKKVDFNSSTTLNTIYKDLLEAVYERQWGDADQHTAADFLSKEGFFRILEEIALAVWHGHGRTASQSAIYQRCEDSSLTQYLKKFSAGAEKGVVRLLTAFYFREAGQESSGDSVFEFTHKSFGEYLTARRIVREVEKIHKKVKRHQQDPDDGISLRGALVKWAEISGQTTVDAYLFGFIQDEIASRKSKTIKKWQKTFAKMLGSAVSDTMPMEKLNLASFKEMLRQSSNAEASILVIYNACFQQSQKVINIDWGDRDSFGRWWKRISGEIDDFFFFRQKLSGLSLSGCVLDLGGFFGANFERGYLERTSFSYSILSYANLTKANLTEANL
ncbi:MAG TPA: NACHT domain-containing protein, partial [Leucothrix sp.]|nr:NACHT domain-containing protein [Leucothrix sp.]